VGGVVFEPVTWAEEYSFSSHGWFQGFRLEVRQFDPFLHMTTNLVADPQPPEPFRHMFGQWDVRFSENELCYILAEIERPLKPVRKLLWIWPIYRPTIRALYPDDGDRHPGVGLIIPDPKEQKRLYAIFNKAYSVLTQL
jgi:hypothetical protein